MILQPDRLLQACLHLSVSFSHPLPPCPPLPWCACCHRGSLHLLLLLQTSFRPAITDIASHPLSLPRFFSPKIPICQAAQLSASFFLAVSRVPGHFCPSTFLCVLQTVPGSFSVFLHLPSFIPPPLACSGSPCGSVWSANGIRCSLYSSRIQGAPGLPVGGGPSSTDHTKAGAQL